LNKINPRLRGCGRSLYSDQVTDIAEPLLADSLMRVLDLLRSQMVTTRPELARISGYGRTVVNQRLSLLEQFGLIENGKLLPSTGGRAPRELVFAVDRASVLVAELGATSIDVGLARLDGEIFASSHESRRIDLAPEVALGNVERMFEQLLGSAVREVWGIGIGVPAPIEKLTGRPAATAVMPAWDSYPVRERLAQKFGVPVWVDNEVNVAALEELRAGAALGREDVLYVKVGNGIGAGIVTGGRLSRGAHGYAGNVPHIEVDHDSSVLCSCGHYGCLEAVAGGVALVKAANALGRHSWELGDLVNAAGRGDTSALDLITFSARKVGTVLAALVNFHNPSLILLGGSVARAHPLFLSTVRNVVFGRSDALATRDLEIKVADVRPNAGLKGAAFIVVDALFEPAYLRQWLPTGSPVSTSEDSH
jgi:predicted NBD/HSP70 family sugar kinase